jgi:hypothetical protein
LPDESDAFGLRRQKCYNVSMKTFGDGPTLEQGCAWLRDEEERVERILDVVERNSVIEGLPPFQEETRRRLKERLKDGSGRGQAPLE